MRQVELRGALLATSSVVALVLGMHGSAQALVPGCAINNQNGAITNTITINCISFNNGGTFTGPVTNATTGKLTGPGNTPPTETGITVVGNSRVTGTITNNGSITASRFGINIGLGAPTFALGGTVDGSIINGSTGAINSTRGFTIRDATIGGDLVNNGTINYTDTGINMSGTAVHGGIVNGSVINNGTISGGGGAITTQKFDIAGSIINSAGATINATNAFAGINPVMSTIGGSIINAGTINSKIIGIEVIETTVIGSVTNSGTLNGQSGIAVTGKNAVAGVINGDIVNSGTINASTFSGISISGFTASATIGGKILNSGTINANNATGIGIFAASVGGSVINTSSISAKNVGILVSNSGFNPAVSSVAGGITNQGSIIANTGIAVNGGSIVAGGITNSGNITGTTTAIDVTGAGAATTINQQAGTISGAILLSALADTVNVTGGAIAGNIVGQGVSNTVNFALGAGNTFTYSNSISGVHAVSVNSGTVDIEGSVAATLTTVNSTGVLTGAGSVGNATTIGNGGSFSPGNATTGTFMTVNGSLAFQSGAQYIVHLSPATASFANVTGAASPGGATVNAIFGSGSFVPKTYTILTATGGVIGVFNPAVASNAPNIQSTLTYDANHVFLNIIKVVFAPPPGGSLNVNQQNVANALTNAFNSGGLPAAFAGLGPAGLTQVSGELATGSQQTTFDAMKLFLGLLTDPFIAGRGDGTAGGPGASPFAEESADADGYASTGRKRAGAERDAYGMITKAVPRSPAFDQRWSVWAAGFGGSQTTDGNAVLGSNAATSRVFGAAAGADYIFSPRTIAGFALAGGGTNFALANALGSGRSDLFQAGAFVRHSVGPAYISAALAYGWQDITTDRTLTIAGVDQLRAKFNANAFSGRVEGGYRFVAPWMGGAGITPYAAGQFTTFDLPAYAERAVVGANTFALSYAAKSVTASRSELGVRTDKSWAMQDGIFTLRGRFAWAHDFNPDRNIAATFQTLPGASFVVNGAAPARDAALTTASAEMKWLNGWSAAAIFEGEFSNVTRSYAGKGVVRYAW